MSVAECPLSVRVLDACRRVVGTRLPISAREPVEKRPGSASAETLALTPEERLTPYLAIRVLRGTQVDVRRTRFDQADASLGQLRAPALAGLARATEREHEVD